MLSLFSSFRWIILILIPFFDIKRLILFYLQKDANKTHYSSSQVFSRYCSMVMRQGASGFKLVTAGRPAVLLAPRFQSNFKPIYFGNASYSFSLGFVILGYFMKPRYIVFRMKSLDRPCSQETSQSYVIRLI